VEIYYTYPLTRIGHEVCAEWRRLLVENLEEMRRLAAGLAAATAELDEFKVHVTGRVERLEVIERETCRNRISMISLLVSVCALLVTLAINFL
jgi:hypothetical protein